MVAPGPVELRPDHFGAYYLMGVSDEWLRCALGWVSTSDLIGLRCGTHGTGSLPTPLLISSAALFAADDSAQALLRSRPGDLCLNLMLRTAQRRTKKERRRPIVVPAGLRRLLAAITMADGIPPYQCRRSRAPRCQDRLRAGTAHGRLSVPIQMQAVSNRPGHKDFPTPGVQRVEAHPWLTTANQRLVAMDGEVEWRRQCPGAGLFHRDHPGDNPLGPLGPENRALGCRRLPHYPAPD